MCDPRGSSQGHEFIRWWLSLHSSYPGAHLQIRWKAAHCLPACRSPAAPDSSAGRGAGSQQGLRGKPERKIRGEQGGGSARVKGCRREGRGQENRESGREETTALDLKTRCVFLFHSVSQRGVTVSAVFWGNPRVES